MAEDVQRARNLLKAYPDEATIDDLSDEDFPRIVGFDVSSVIDISSAKVFIGGEWITVGVMRVRIEQVGAWWPLASEEGANIVFNFAPISSG